MNCEADMIYLENKIVELEERLADLRGKAYDLMKQVQAEKKKMVKRR